MAVCTSVSNWPIGDACYLLHALQVRYTSVCFPTSVWTIYWRLSKEQIRGMVWYGLGRISHDVKIPLIVIQVNISAVGYRDGALRPHALPLIRQRNLTLQQDNAKPHVDRVCSVFLTQTMCQLTIGHHTVQICSQSNICGTSWAGWLGRASMHQLMQAPIQEWNNIAQTPWWGQC